MYVVIKQVTDYVSYDQTTDTKVLGVYEEIDDVLFKEKFRGVIGGDTDIVALKFLVNTPNCRGIFNLDEHGGRMVWVDTGSVIQL